MGQDIIQQIKSANAGRETGPLKLKYEAMAESPFRFFRGSCQLFYDELQKDYPFPASPNVWACGDLHIENFGSYKGANRLGYFDMNDFDEALLAPALWDAGRLAASVQIAAAAAGFSRKEKAGLVNTLLYAYRHTLKKGKAMIIERETARGLIGKLIAKVSGRKEMDLVRKRTDNLNPGKLALTSRLLALAKQDKKFLLHSFNQWLTDKDHPGLRAIDAGFRIAGTGSIGVKRYILLLAHSANPQKKFLVDVKQALPAAAARYAAVDQPIWLQEAERIVTVQEMMQHISPAFLSFFKHDENWFVVKELQPIADKINLFQTIKQWQQMENYFGDLGALTASAQLRSSGRKGSANADELNHFASNDNWINIVNSWSQFYNEKVNQDYAVYKEAWQDGSFSS